MIKFNSSLLISILDSIIKPHHMEEMEAENFNIKLQSINGSILLILNMINMSKVFQLDQLTMIVRGILEVVDITKDNSMLREEESVELM